MAEREKSRCCNDPNLNELNYRYKEDNFVQNSSTVIWKITFCTIKPYRKWLLQAIAAGGSSTSYRFMNYLQSFKDFFFRTLHFSRFNWPTVHCLEDWLKIIKQTALWETVASLRQCNHCHNSAEKCSQVALISAPPGTLSTPVHQWGMLCIDMCLWEQNECGTISMYEYYEYQLDLYYLHVLVVHESRKKR